MKVMTDKYLEIKVGQVFQCEDLHIWIYCKGAKRTKTGGVYHYFMRPDTIDSHMWTYSATKIDTLCKKFPMLEAHVRSGGDSSDEGLNFLHDVIAGAIGRKPTTIEIQEIYDDLPPHVKQIAEEWGFEDTVFRDEAYKEIVEAEKHKKEGSK